MENKFKGKKIAVLGLGIEGEDSINFFLKCESDITVFDQKEEKDLDLTRLPTKELKFVCGKNYLDSDFSEFDLIVRSPGIYRYSPQLLKAEKNGSKITSNVKLFFDLCPSKIIGVTGTKGKGTTSTLIYQILKTSNFDVHLGGNIGKPALSLLSSVKEDSIVVLELSSFQLIDLNISPHIAVVLNVTVDHMDWHKDRNEYVLAKENIVKHQSIDDFSVINQDYSDSKNFSKKTCAIVHFFSSKTKTNGCYIENREIVLNVDKKEIIGNVNDLLLRGKHNWENINAAVCASYLAGAKLTAIKQTVFNFKGLEHRLELVGDYKDITFYNDSFSTNPQTTIAAIKSFTEPLTLILGGSDKGLEYVEMAQEIFKTPNVKSIVLMGQIADQIQADLVKSNFKGKIVNLGMTTMEMVVEKSLELSKKGFVVLLTPATASFGMFTDYKDRGNKFKMIIEKLIR